MEESGNKACDIKRKKNSREVAISHKHKGLITMAILAVSRLPTNFNHYPPPCLILWSYISFTLVHLSVWETVCKAYQWGPVEEGSASWHGQTTGNSMRTPCHQWYRWGEWECTDESVQLYGCVWDISVFHMRPVMLLPVASVYMYQPNELVLVKHNYS